MHVVGYDWLYEMQIPPRRVIRLKPQRHTNGGYRWQHYAIRLICFEYERGREDESVLPAFDIEISQTQLLFYFDRNDQMVFWERPTQPRRRAI